MIKKPKRKGDIRAKLSLRVLFTAKLEFPKILVPKVPQNILNVSIECAGKSKQLYSFL